VTRSREQGEKKKGERNEGRALFSLCSAAPEKDLKASTAAMERKEKKRRREARIPHSDSELSMWRIKEGGEKGLRQWCRERIERRRGGRRK